MVDVTLQNSRQKEKAGTIAAFMKAKNFGSEKVVFHLTGTLYGRPHAPPRNSPLQARDLSSHPQERNMPCQISWCYSHGDRLLYLDIWNDYVAWKTNGKAL
jgi:hypothetical protein